MENNILKPTCQRKAGRVLFYVFEIVALVVGALYFVLAIVNAAQWGTFMTFVDGLVTAAIWLFLLYGVGRIIDLLYKQAEK